MSKTLGKILTRKQRIKKFVGFCSFVTTVILFILLVFFLFTSFILVTSTDTYNPTFGLSGVYIISPSMVPEILVGDYAICKKKDSYSEGATISFFRQNEKLYTHQITELAYGVNGVQYKTKGVAEGLTEDEEPALNANVVGEVILVIPKIGWLIKFFSEIPIIVRIVFSIITTTLLVVTIIIEIVKSNKEYKLSRKDNDFDDRINFRFDTLVTILEVKHSKKPKFLINIYARIIYSGILFKNRIIDFKDFLIFEFKSLLPKKMRQQ